MHLYAHIFFSWMAGKLAVLITVWFSSWAGAVLPLAGLCAEGPPHKSLGRKYFSYFEVLTECV